MIGVQPTAVRPQNVGGAAPFGVTPNALNPVNRALDTFNGDQVSVSDFFGDLAAGLMERLNGAGSGLVSFEYAVMEVTARVQVGGRFQADTGSGTGAIEAYREQGGASTGALEYGYNQAAEIAQAHAAAFNGDYFGPEATAERITSFALSFFPLFAKDHPEMSYEDQVDSFRTLVEGAIGRGFDEALGILGALPREVSGGIEQTRSLVFDQLDAFFAQLNGDGADKGKEALANGTFSDYVTGFLESFNRPAS